jgi:cobalt-zinc-cadmium resistance protein CzcA
VTVIFKDGTDIYFARQLVNERIQEARDRCRRHQPPGADLHRPGRDLPVDGGGRAGAASRTAPLHPTDLREIQDWIIKPQLRNVPGVTEINSIGGFAKEYQVAPHPSGWRPTADAGDVVTRWSATTPTSAPATSSAGRAVPDPRAGPGARHRRHRNVIGTGQRADPHPRRGRGGLGRELRTGAATDNGREVVLGTVFMLIGENSRTVSQAVDKRMEEINRTCPRRAGGHGLRPHHAGGQGHRHGQEEPARRRDPGHRHPVPVPGQHPRGADHRLVIPLSMLFTFTGMVATRSAPT